MLSLFIISSVSCLFVCFVYICVVGNGRVNLWFVFFFQAEDGIRDLVRSRGLGDVYKRQDIWRIRIYKRFSCGKILSRLQIVHYRRRNFRDPEACNSPWSVKVTKSFFSRIRIFKYICIFLQSQNKKNNVNNRRKRSWINRQSAKELQEKIWKGWYR